MMLSLASLSAAATLSADVFSPSRNPCMVKIPQLDGASRYRINPYGACVLPPLDLSPAFGSAAAASSICPPQRKTRTPPPMAPPLTQCVVARLPPAAAPTAPPSPLNLAAVVRCKTTIVRCESNAAADVPAAAAPIERTRFVAIKFKHDYMWFLAPFKVTVGDLVAVEGDRGENLGTVEEITAEKPEQPVTQRIVRHANQKDRDHLAMLRRKEAAATKVCQEIAESVGLTIRVVDTEYQYDMNKLTIFFASKVPVDFRKLQRELFREFRCRIWIVNWPRKPLHP